MQHTDDTDVQHTGPVIPEIGCTVPPSGPFGGRVLDTPRAYPGIAFDTLGDMVSCDNNSLLISSSPTDTSLLMPNTSSSQQMNFLQSLSP